MMPESLVFQDGGVKYRIVPRLLARDLLVELRGEASEGSRAAEHMVVLIEHYFGAGGTGRLFEFATQLAAEHWEETKQSVNVADVEQVFWGHLRMTAREDAVDKRPWYVKLFWWF